MEEDILNYSPTVMFRGTPCTSRSELFIRESLWILQLLENCTDQSLFNLLMQIKALICNSIDGYVSENASGTFKDYNCRQFLTMTIFPLR